MTWKPGATLLAFSCLPRRRNPAHERRGDEKHCPAQFAPMLFDNLALAFVWLIEPSRVSELQNSKGVTLMDVADPVVSDTADCRPLARKEVNLRAIKRSIREP
jgi:hypothetical protein